MKVRSIANSLGSGLVLNEDSSIELKVMKSIFTEHVNLILLFEERPSIMSKQPKSLVKNIIQYFTMQFNRDSLTLEIPTVFERIKQKNPQMEVISSNTLQPATLFYQKNIVSSSIARIFTNTKAMGVEYKNAVARGKLA